MAEPSTRNHEQVMNDYTALWNGNFAKLDVVAPSVDVSHPSAPDGEVRGRDALEALIRDLHAGFSDFNVVVHDWMSRDDLVMKEYTMTGTHDGELRGVPPTGREVESPGMEAILVDGGEVQEVRAYYNRLAALEQLGLTDG
jgi:steroid delta-isomerase-like uncharacterized protein